MRVIRNLKNFTFGGKKYLLGEKFNITDENIMSIWDLQARGFITALTMDEYRKIKNKMIKKESE